MAALAVVGKIRKSISNPQMTSAGHEVTFISHAPESANVCLAGKSNDWNMTTMSLKKGSA